MKSRTLRLIQTCRPIAGWCVLLLYLGMYSPAGLGVATLIGTLDPDHRARVHVGESGLRLVLHHGLNCAGHHHRVVARVLTAFAQPASSTDPDHVIQFNSADSLDRKEQISLPQFSGCEQTALVLINTTLLALAPDIESPIIPRPPSGGGEIQRCLRSTILLI